MPTIPLPGGLVTLVDDEDYPTLSRSRWGLLGGAIARPVRYERGETILMSRQIMNAPSGMVVDHINGDPLDNRRSNLRVCTHAENMRNRRKSRASTQPYKGVERQRNGAWMARITAGGQRHARGGFSTAEAASQEYDRLALQLHGPFARLNRKNPAG